MCLCRELAYIPSASLNLTSRLFPFTPCSQTEQEMRKIKINPINSYYYPPQWICSSCVRTDNTFNNPALLLICVEMVFQCFERSN